MPIRIQRLRTKGWRMPEGGCAFLLASLQWANGMEQRSFWNEALPYVRRAGGLQTQRRLCGAAALASAYYQERAQQRLPERETGGRASGRNGLPQGLWRSQPQGQVQSAATRRDARRSIREDRRCILRSMRLLRQTRPPLRSQERRRTQASQVTAVRQCLLQSALSYERKRTAGNFSGSVRELQLYQARGARGMAVAPCQ